MNTYYIYQHTRPDKDQIFYIGIGKTGTKRSKSSSGRNKHWKAVVKKNDGVYKIEIIHTNLTFEQAQEMEVTLIKKYGRSVDGGTLTNVLEGGQLQDIGPNYARQWSKDVKKRMSQGHLGNKSTTGMIWINNGELQSLIFEKDGIPEGWVKGSLKRYEMTDETRKKMSLSKKGMDMGFTTEQRKTWSTGNKACQGMIWITDGSQDLLVHNKEIPDGWRRGRSLVTNPTGHRGQF